MKYRFLGKSGLRVSRICLGTMTFGNSDWGCDQDEATNIVKSYIDHGGNFIDTADLYSAGVSEQMLGNAIADQSRHDLVIATKCWFPTGEGANARGLSRKHIIEACDASLVRLGTDFVDLYQIHGPDPYTPIQETMRAFDDLVRAGKVRYIGCSNLYGWQIAKAQMIAESMHMETFVSAQHMFNLVRRDVEREILPACDDLGLGMICWGPLASGLLTGKYRGLESPDADSRLGKHKVFFESFWSEASTKLVDLLISEAERLEKSPTQVSLAWLLGDSRVSATIVGARTQEQIEDSLGAGDWDIPKEARDTLTDALPTFHGYPKEWMDSTFPRTFSIDAAPPRHEVGLP